MYKLYQDNAHGWVAVDRSELVALGIADKISNYSYQNGDTVYLEEDCDATLFKTALENAGGSLSGLQVINHYGQSKIRNFERYAEVS